MAKEEIEEKNKELKRAETELESFKEAGLKRLKESAQELIKNIDPELIKEIDEEVNKRGLSGIGDYSQLGNIDNYEKFLASGMSYPGLEQKIDIRYIFRDPI